MSSDSPKHIDIEALAARFVKSQANNMSTIPIVGDDVFLYQGSDGVRKTIMRYIVDRFIDDYPEIGASDVLRSGRADLFALTCISKSIGNNHDFVMNFKSYMAEAEGSIEIDPVVLDFLNAFKFPLIVTTSCFTFFDRILNRTAMPAYQTYAYNYRADNSRTNIGTVLDNAGMIYHLFGTAESRTPCWVYNEDMLLEFMHHMHSSDGYSCINLAEYVAETQSQILLLGCGLPDWLFRFLWYSIGNIDKQSRSGIWLNKGTINIELDHFLRNINYSPVATVREFLTRVTELQLSRTAKAKTGQSEGSYDYFISYAGEDRPIAERLYRHLLTRGFNVWFDMDGDSEIKWGDKYAAQFRDGIERSRHAIVIITENYIRGVADPGRGLCQETKFIKEKSMRVDSDSFHFCMPLLIENRQYNKRPLTTAMVEEWAPYAVTVGGLSELFTGTSMRTTDGDNPTIPSSL